PGDLAFFDDTYDRDGDGRTNDPLTHVGVVLSVDAAGTIVVAHGGTSRGRTTLRMNLLHPHDAADAHGDTINDPLRARRSGDPAGTRYLAAELWRGFATVPPAR
ncbi:MAG TPA: CHAP domain-containing protein, partial [Myxococcota bacterium]|nr:CHAP domain-containing protein [Myxococcota bacterium]